MNASSPQAPLAGEPSRTFSLAFTRGSRFPAISVASVTLKSEVPKAKTTKQIQTKENNNTQENLPGLQMPRPKRDRLNRTGSPDSKQNSRHLALNEDSCQELDRAADELAAIIIEFYRQWKQL